MWTEPCFYKCIHKSRVSVACASGPRERAAAGKQKQNPSAALTVSGSKDRSEQKEGKKGEQQQPNNMGWLLTTAKECRNRVEEKKCNWNWRLSLCSVCVGVQSALSRSSYAKWVCFDRLRTESCFHKGHFWPRRPRKNGSTETGRGERERTRTTAVPSLRLWYLQLPCSPC